jgi:hypothetical protein
MITFYKNSGLLKPILSDISHYKINLEVLKIGLGRKFSFSFFCESFRKNSLFGFVKYLWWKYEFFVKVFAKTQRWKGITTFMNKNSFSYYSQAENLHIIFLLCQNNFKEYSILKGQCHQIFYPWFFHQTIPPGPLIHRLKPFWILLQICRDMINFRTWKLCMWCQWHRMLEKIFLGSPFKFISFLSGGVGHSGTCTMHVVSMTPDAF